MSYVAIKLKWTNEGGIVDVNNRYFNEIKDMHINEFIDKYGFKCPTGVRGRNSDNKLYKEKVGWEVSQPLIDGMRKTFEWINAQTNN